MVLGKSPPYNLRTRNLNFTNPANQEEQERVTHTPITQGQGRNCPITFSQTTPMFGENGAASTLQITPPDCTSRPQVAEQFLPQRNSFPPYAPLQGGNTFGQARVGPPPNIFRPQATSHFGAHNTTFPRVFGDLGTQPAPGFQTQPSQEDLTRLVTQVVTTIMQMPEINRNVNIANNNLSQNDVNNTSRVGNFSNLSLAEASKILPIFDNEGSIQPLDFLQYLEGCFEVNSIPFKKLSLVLNNVYKKSAKLWWDAFSNKFDTYNEFKVAFIEQFWGPNKQLEIKLKLESGRFAEGEGLLVDHFNYYVALAKHLQPPYSTEQLISTIARHFPPNVSAILIGTTSISQALDRLRHADHYFNNAPRERGNFNFKNKDTYHKGNTGFNKNFPSNRVFEKNPKNISTLEVQTETILENEQPFHG